MRKKIAKPTRARTAKPPIAPPTIGPMGVGVLLGAADVVCTGGEIVDGLDVVVELLSEVEVVVEEVEVVVWVKTI